MKTNYFDLGHFVKNTAIICGGQNFYNISKECFELDPLSNRYYSCSQIVLILKGN